jgi:hypothetical protein
MHTKPAYLTKMENPEKRGIITAEAVEKNLCKEM